MVCSFALAYGVMSLILILGVPRQSLSQNTRAKGVLIRSLPSVARYENDLNRIQELVHTGRYSQALERIDELLKQVPDMAQGRFLKPSPSSGFLRRNILFCPNHITIWQSSMRVSSSMIRLVRAF